MKGETENPKPGFTMLSIRKGLFLLFTFDFSLLIFDLLHLPNSPS